MLRKIEYSNIMVVLINVFSFFKILGDICESFFFLKEYVSHSYLVVNPPQLSMFGRDLKIINVVRSC